MKIKICRRVILSVALHGYETWSFTLREEHRLMSFENRVLRKMIRPKRDEVTGDWRKLHKDVLCTKLHNDVLCTKLHNDVLCTKLHKDVLCTKLHKDVLCTKLHKDVLCTKLHNDVLCTLHQCYSDDQIEKNKNGRTCGMHGR
jgi:hypothetical protein